MRPVICLITVLLAWVPGRPIRVASDSPGEERRPQRVRFGPGVCGPADPTYIRGATETGGHLFFLSPAEVSKSAQIISGSLQTELMLWASGDGEKAYSVPVDSTVERTMFSASFDTRGGVLAVISPDGTVFEQGDRSQDTVLNCGRVITIDAPAKGVWQLRVAPTGRFWLTAESKSALSLTAAEFVHAGGRPGHEGLFRIQGQPVAGKPATLRVSVSSGAKSSTFRLVSLDALPLQELELKSLGDEEFVGTFDLPGVPFRVFVTGLEDSGLPYQRMFAGLFHAEQIEVVPPTGETIVAGAVSPVTFTVRNSGPSVRLNLVSTSQGKVLTAEPTTLQLDQGAEAAVIVRLTVPADAAPEARVDVSLSAFSDAASPAGPFVLPPGNRAMKEFTVRPAR